MANFASAYDCVPDGTFQPQILGEWLNFKFQYQIWKAFHVLFYSAQMLCICLYDWNSF